MLLTAGRLSDGHPERNAQWQHNLTQLDAIEIASVICLSKSCAFLGLSILLYLNSDKTLRLIPSLNKMLPCPKKLALLSFYRKRDFLREIFTSGEMMTHPLFFFFTIFFELPCEIFDHLMPMWFGIFLSLQPWEQNWPANCHFSTYHKCQFFHRLVIQKSLTTIHEKDELWQ